MFKSSHSTERRIFFPWEGRGRLRRLLALGRVWPVVILALALSFVWWVGKRERLASGERRTRVALLSLRAPVERYLLENDGDCPGKLTEVLVYSHLESLPRDGWGFPLRIVCPSGLEGRTYLLMSDGPDGQPGGLDRIEL